jgi:polysaccharide biosynthesis transport protein
MSQATIRPQDVLNTVKRHWLLLVAPVIVLTAAAVTYALLRPATWEASQALVVRNETGDASNKLGAISQLEDMKTTQETILELARNRGVLLNALTKVGRPADATGEWPNEKALEGLRDSVSVVPPKGAEFGKTEVFYLKVQDHDRQRAIALAAAVSVQLQQRLSALREATSRGAIDELVRSQSLAQEDLTEATKALSSMEKQVGKDLAELRILSDSPSGDSDLRRNLLELEKELRAYKATQVENQESLKLLQEAQADPQKLLAAPGLLLKSQPALSRLKDGLVDAQLRSGQALGTMSEDHPMVRGAREAERVIREQLYNEIAVAIKGAEADINIGADRIQSLEADLAATQARLNRLVAQRAQYSNLADAVKNRAETLKNVEHQLAEARAAHAATLSTSRINLVDKPDAGTRPIGPGRTVIAAGGFGGGVLVAAAILFLLIHPVPVHSPAVVEEPSEPGTLSLEASAPKLAKPAGPLSLSKALQRVAS